LQKGGLQGVAAIDGLEAGICFRLKQFLFGNRTSDQFSQSGEFAVLGTMGIPLSVAIMKVSNRTGSKP
jgi:hypothetical protein